MEKILIVDDSPLQAAHLKDILGDEYDITVAQTPEDGLYQASTDTFSLILLDVVMPGMDGFTLLKKLQEEIITQSVPVILIGRLGGRNNKGSRASYQRYYDDRRDDRRDYGRPRAVSGFDYDDIVFDTRGDADLVLDQMESAINQYSLVSVADLYDLAGITCRSYTANKYGWTDLRGAKVVRVRDGYILELPRTVQIN